MVGSCCGPRAQMLQPKFINSYGAIFWLLDVVFTFSHILGCSLHCLSCHRGQKLLFYLVSPWFLSQCSSIAGIRLIWGTVDLVNCWWCRWFYLVWTQFPSPCWPSSTIVKRALFSRTRSGKVRQKELGNRDEGAKREGRKLKPQEKVKGKIKQRGK